MTEIRAAAGQRIAIIRRAFSSVPMDYRFSARAEKADQPLVGRVEIRKSRWVIPGSPATLPLQHSNVVSAGFWNTFLSVDVISEVDVVLTTERRSGRGMGVILLLAIAVVVIAAATIVISI
jgi:hypothetical protein